MAEVADPKTSVRCLGGVLNASLEAIQAGQDLLEARVAELQAVQAQLQAGQAQLQDGLQQLQIAVENIGVCILLNTISPSSFIYLFFFPQEPTGWSISERE